MKKTIKLVIRHIVLALLALIWLIPIIWLVFNSLSANKGVNTQYFIPKEWSLDNYIQLFFRPDGTVNFMAWFGNTFTIAIFTCIISTSFVLMVAYAFSCMRFKSRKSLMSFSIISGMFPGVLSMLAIYHILKAAGLTEGQELLKGFGLEVNDALIGLIIVYSAGAGLGYLICKGFFDTIPISLREAAKIEGASEFTIFWRVVIPLSKPIIVYTVINSFLGPWMDFVMAQLMIKSKVIENFTVAVGLYNLLQKTSINNYFGVFCAGGVIIAIPCSILFVIMQKFYVEGITGGAVKG